MSKLSSEAAGHGPDEAPGLALDSSPFCDSPVGRSHVRILHRLRNAGDSTVGEYPSGRTDPNYIVHRSLSFFIDWLHRPKLEFVESFQDEITVRFRVGSEIVPKTVEVLFYSVGNLGVVPAENPAVFLHVKRFEEKSSGQRWLTVRELLKEVGEADFIPIQTFAEERSEEEFAIALSKRGFATISEIAHGQTARFIVGFAFEKGENFYFGGEFVRPIPIGKGRRAFVSLSARCHNRLQIPLWTADYFLEIKAWNSLSLTELKREGKLMVGA